MAEVRVNKGEELIGLGATLKEIMDKNLKAPKKYSNVEKTNASVVIEETTSGVAATFNFKGGEIEIQNDAIDRPTGYMEPEFENLAYIGSGQLSPTKAMFTGKLKSGGNPITFLNM